MSIKKIIRLFFHPMTIKIVGLIFIVGFFFILPSYAQNIQTQGLVKVQSFLEKFLSLCSRGWIVLAILAGKLMTNDFVYGAFIHMDVYLWKIRNIMKNFANFALAGLVLYSIIKGLVGKEALDVKKVITKTLVAGILIQSSWFLMGALIDISTVATAGISAFPISFLKNDPTLKKKITSSINIFKSNRPIINFNATGTNWVHTIDKPLTNPQDGEELRENVLPSYNSVSGPFIYLGMGVFNFQNYLTTKNSTEVVPLTLGFALRLFLLFLFTVGLLLLLIANIMRIGLLWVFIIGSPFLILAQVFDVGKGDKGLGGLFKISNLIAIAFKPVIFVAGISLMLIVIVSMQTSITGSGATRENDLNGVTLGMTGDGNTTSTLTVKGITNISVNQGDLLGKDVVEQGQNIFSHLIMLLLTIFLMRRFIKLSLITGGGPIEKTMERLTGLAENFAKSAPILPGGGSFTAASKAMEINKNKAFEGMGMNKAGEFGQLDANGKNFQTNKQQVDDYIGAKRFGELPSWKPADYKSLEKIADDRTSTNFFSASKELAKSRRGGLSVNDTGRLAAFQKLSPTQLSKFNGSLEKQATEDQIKAYFDDKGGRNAKALYNALGGYPASKQAEPSSYETLKKITFHATQD